MAYLDEVELFSKIVVLPCCHGEQVGIVLPRVVGLISLAADPFGGNDELHNAVAVDLRELLYFVGTKPSFGTSQATHEQSTGHRGENWLSSTIRGGTIVMIPNC